MEQELSKGRKPASRLTSERFRCLVYFVAITCMISCIVVLFVSQVSMERRVALVESTLREISNELKQIRAKIDDAKESPSALHVRRERNANPTTTLADLTKRIITLEGRSSFRGRDGRDGMPGPPGPAGRDGRDGREGPAGPRGMSGSKGPLGRPGSPGPQGPAGPQGTMGPEGPGLSGVSYNRWGRTSCSGDAITVYTGSMGGGYYTHTGGGTNYVCLTNNPIYDKYQSGWQGKAAIYGTEYQTSFPGFTRGNLDQHDAPCAVCYVRSRGSQVMIPGTNKCPSGWTREYYGYLMTSHYNHAHPSEFVCVDADAEVVPGRDGRDGMSGPPGPAGRDGRDGRIGPAGPPGLTGPKGQDGRDGRIGPAGPPGLTGPKGFVGRPGSPGPQGPAGPQGAMGLDGPGLSGVSYNRWGRTNCSGDASVVYTGAMGGGYYTHTGGGANYLCLTNNPIYDKYQSGWQGNAAIYGTEYQTSFPGFTRGSLHNHDAPCAVCYVRSRGSQVMIPGTNKCPSGWTREYYGYLMTSHYGHAHPSEFVCVDVEAEVLPGSYRDTDGALLYVVEASCSHGLPCKPYIHGYELTCAVCTK